MKKYKSALVYLLAFNAVTFTYGATISDNVRTENLYKQTLEDINSGKKTKTSYEQIEKILNQKNKELKDLYLQGDYIVKPEYLEW